MARKELKKSNLKKAVAVVAMTTAISSLSTVAAFAEGTEEPTVEAEEKEEKQEVVAEVSEKEVAETEKEEPVIEEDAEEPVEEVEEEAEEPVIEEEAEEPEEEAEEEVEEPVVEEEAEEPVVEEEEVDEEAQEPVIDEEAEEPVIEEEVLEKIDVQKVEEVCQNLPNAEDVKNYSTEQLNALQKQLYDLMDLYDAWRESGDYDAAKDPLTSDVMKQINALAEITATAPEAPQNGAATLEESGKTYAETTKAVIIRVDENNGQKEVEYESLANAIADAKDQETIRVVNDCDEDKVDINTNKAVTVEDIGTHTIKINTYLNIVGGSSLSFKNCTLEVSGANTYIVFMNNGSTLTLDHSNMTMDGLQADGTRYNAHGIWMDETGSQTLNVLNQSKLIITNYEQDAIEWDNGTHYINIENDSFVDLSKCRSGIAGTLNVTVDNSELDILNNSGNATNGSNFIVKNNAVVKVNNNGSNGLSAANFIIEDSTVEANNNGMNGISINGAQPDQCYIKNSTITVSGNRCSAESIYTKAGALSVKNAVLTIEDDVVLNITNNMGSGLRTWENGEIIVKTGTITNNQAVKVQKGGGIYNEGKITLSDNVVICNNHAGDQADDVYNQQGATLNLIAISKDKGWVLDDCDHPITGWYVDAADARWKAAAHTFNGDVTCGTGEGENALYDGALTITGELALKAAHGELTQHKVIVNYYTKTINADGTVTRVLTSSEETTDTPLYELGTEITETMAATAEEDEDYKLISAGTLTKSLAADTAENIFVFNYEKVIDNTPAGGTTPGTTPGNGGGSGGGGGNGGGGGAGTGHTAYNFGTQDTTIADAETPLADAGVLGIEDADVPLAAVPFGVLGIMDGPVPLAALPMTGDSRNVAALIFAASALSFFALGYSEKRARRAKARKPQA